MSVALASTWNPRGEERRFWRMLPQLRKLYETMCVVLPPDADSRLRDEMLEFGLKVVQVDTWPDGRRESLRLVEQTGVDYVHYCDMDRLLRWQETRPDELRETVERVQTVDCLLIGRTEAAMKTHPQALINTEALYHCAFAETLGAPLDISSGSKGFSMTVVRFLLRNTQPGHGLGTDAEWAILPSRAWFKLEKIWVDGLDWETADRHRNTAADPETQQREAAKVDQDPEQWRFRVWVAHEILRDGLDALRREIK